MSESFVDGAPLARVAADVSAPIDRVWNLLTDLESLADVFTGIARTERLAGDGFEQGVTWREFATMSRQEIAEDLRVEMAESPTRAVIASSNGGVEFRTEYRLESRPGADGGPDWTHLTFSTFADASAASSWQRLTWGVLGGSMRNATRKALGRDIDDVVAWAERESGSPEAADD